ncbi:MAG: type II toxin-antitoxin system RelE/ParE family toxin [Elusimicrobia bacterium]|nr:type II toxin-antitoxin system RelE/ParE family toxin [Elusimicrobiota bacterium]MBU2614157.1 type II toxin-antitoxin system RelE/ParE family toxin [Elusimicrobiota bacterium]
MVQEIKWTRQSYKDLRNIYDFIALDSIRYAQVQIENIIQSTLKLAKYPLIGRKIPEFPHLPYREIIADNYRIIYQITKEKHKIIIMTIIHGRRLLPFK